MKKVLGILLCFMMLSSAGYSAMQIYGSSDILGGQLTGGVVVYTDNADEVIKLTCSMFVGTVYKKTTYPYTIYSDRESYILHSFGFLGSALGLGLITNDIGVRVELGVEAHTLMYDGARLYSGIHLTLFKNLLLLSYQTHWREVTPYVTQPVNTLTVGINVDFDMFERARTEKLRKEERARAEKLRKEERARAEKLRKEERARAEKLRKEERARAEKLRKEERARAEKLRKEGLKKEKALKEFLERCVTFQVREEKIMTYGYTTHSEIVYKEGLYYEKITTEYTTPTTVWRPALGELLTEGVEYNINCKDYDYDYDIEVYAGSDCLDHVKVHSNGIYVYYSIELLQKLPDKTIYPEQKEGVTYKKYTGKHDVRIHTTFNNKVRWEKGWFVPSVEIQKGKIIDGTYFSKTEYTEYEVNYYLANVVVIKNGKIYREGARGKCVLYDSKEYDRKLVNDGRYQIQNLHKDYGWIDLYEEPKRIQLN